MILENEEDCFKVFATQQVLGWVIKTQAISSSDNKQQVIDLYAFLAVTLEKYQGRVVND